MKRPTTIWVARVNLYGPTYLTPKRAKYDSTSKGYIVVGFGGMDVKREGLTHNGNQSAVFASRDKTRVQAWIDGIVAYRATLRWQLALCALCEG